MKVVVKASAGWLAGRFRKAAFWRRGRAQASWQPVDDGWWRLEAGALEVHLRRAPEIGWQVELRDPGQDRSLGRPTFSARMEDASRVAGYLFTRYGNGAAAAHAGNQRRSPETVGP